MQTVLIAGAGGGVGRVLARRLSAKGVRLVLVGRRARPDFVSDDAVWIEADVSTQAGARHAVQSATEHFGAPSEGVVNAVGSILVAPITRTSEAQYRETLAANLDSAFFLAQAQVAACQAAKQGGSIVLFSSVAARIGVANHAAIAVAKAGVEALVRSLAADVSTLGLRINAVSPGLMATPLGERFLGNDMMREQMAAQYPLGRVGRGEDAAAAADWLLSDESSWVTGQVIGVDGGFSAVRPATRRSA